MNDPKANDAISRSAVLDVLREWRREYDAKTVDEWYLGKFWATDDAIDLVESAPALDVAPVVHGEFERQPEEVFPCIRANPVLCKTCNTTFITLNKEGKRHMCCPYCGARMDGEAE